jgi:hypothetical protein
VFKSFFVACVIALGGACTVDAATVRLLLLDEIIDTAAIAFQGTCTANRVEQDTVTNFIVTYTTFEVRDVIKGNVTATHVIKQIGGTLPGGESGMIVQGVPKFVVGEEYVVFLAGVSSLGFSSPVGLSQGRFEVQQGAAGKSIANGKDFRELTARMPQAVMPDSGAGKNVRQLGLDEFKQMVRTHASYRQ